MGYIKLFRNIEDWGWYDDPGTLALWVHLLISANWKDRVEWHGLNVERGSLITSVARLSADSGLSGRQVRTCLGRLVRTGEIKMEATNKWTKITICKYDTYQSMDDEECQAADEQPTSIGHASDIQTTTIEESKKVRKEEGKKDKPNYAEAAARIYALYPTQTVRPEGNTVSLKSAKKDKDKILRMLTNGEFTEDSLTYAVTRYLAETKKEYLKLFQTFLNQVPDYSEQKVLAPAPEDNWLNGRKPQE